MYISEDDVEKLHYALVDFFATDGDPISPPGIRDAGLLSSAVHRPETGLGGVNKYRTLDEKAAALLHSLIMNHPFHNGNKRTALVSCFIYYDRAGATLEATEAELYNFITDIAKGSIANINEKENKDVYFEKIVKWLRSHKRIYITSHGDISIAEFVECCRGVGANITENKKGGSLGISYNGKSIRISMATQRIGSSAMKRYISQLGMSEAHSGVKFDEFINGTFRESNVFKKILPVLRRLALT